MADRVEPSPNKGAKIYAVGATFRHAGLVDGWVAPTDTAYVADVDTGVTGAPLNAFDQTSSTSSFTVTIDTGEGFFDGRWCARDVTTDVTLASGTLGQVVYAGWQQGATNAMIIGLDADFGANDGQVPLWEFDTDANGVTSATRRYTLGPAIDSDGGDLVVNALLDVTGGMTLSSSITTSRTGFIDAPLKINDQTAYSEFNNWATVYNNDGSGWRFRNGSTNTNAFWVDQTGDAAFPEGSVQLRLENRTSDPSAPAAGRIWYRTDLE